MIEIIVKALFKILFYIFATLLSAFAITLTWGLFLSNTGYRITYGNSVGLILIAHNIMHIMKFFYDLDYKKEDK